MSQLDLSKATSSDLAARASRYLVWDKLQPGLGVRVSPSGEKTFVVKVRLGRGRFAEQRWVTLGRWNQLSVRAARLEAKATLARALTKHEPEPRPVISFNDAPTIAKLCDMWLEKAAHRRRGRGPLAGTLRKQEYIENDRGRIEAHIKPLLGAVRVRELRRRHIEEYRDAVSRGQTKQTKKGRRLRGVTRVKGGEGTANRSLALLSTILSFAVREEILDRNPCFGIERSPGNMRERFLSPEEFGRLGEVIARAEAEGANRQGIAVLRLLALSGARKSEIETLTWGAVDLHTGFLRLPRSKTGPRVILITAAMRAIFEKLERRGDDDWVFPNRDDSAPFDGLNKMWVGIRGVARLHGVRLHDLRHSAASFALMSGVGLEVIGKLLGHTDIKTTRRYAHLADVVVRAAAEQTADQIADLMHFREPAAAPTRAAATAIEPPAPPGRDSNSALANPRGADVTEAAQSRPGALAQTASRYRPLPRLAARPSPGAPARAAKTPRVDRQPSLFDP